MLLAAMRALRYRTRHNVSRNQEVDQTLHHPRVNLAPLGTAHYSIGRDFFSYRRRHSSGSLGP
jgi:hypothetical protein